MRVLKFGAGNCRVCCSESEASTVFKMAGYNFEKVICTVLLSDQILNLYMYLTGSEDMNHFPASVEYQRHKNGVVDQQDVLQPRYPCPDCGRRFQFNCHLETHMRIHLGIKPFHCTECGAAFTQRSNLNVHMKRHLKEQYSML